MNDDKQQLFQNLTLRDLLTPVFRYKHIAAVAFFAVFALVVAFYFTWAQNYYVSTMQVVVEHERSDETTTPGPNQAVTNSNAVSPDQVASEVSLLQGTDMLRSVVQACGLASSASWNDWMLPADPELRRAHKIESATKRLAKKLKVESTSTSDVIDIKYGNTISPESPACVLRTLGELYIAKHVQLRRAVGTSAFFAQETNNFKKQLSDAEQRLADFSKTAGIAAPDSMRSDMASQLALSEGAYYQTLQQVDADRKKLKDLNVQLSTTPSRSTTTEASAPATLLIQHLQEALLDAQLKRTQLLVKYDRSYPLVKEAEEEIATTQKAIENSSRMTFVSTTTNADPTYEYVREEAAKTRADLASQEAIAIAQSRSGEMLRSRLVDLDQKAIQQSALIREVKADETTYLMYLNKRDQELTSDALDQRKIGNVAISVPPIVPVLPAYSLGMILALGVFLSGFTAIVAIVTAEYLDPSFRTPADVIDSLNIHHCFAWLST